jgi:hypothetical protein
MIVGVSVQRYGRMSKPIGLVHFLPTKSLIRSGREFLLGIAV